MFYPIIRSQENIIVSGTKAIIETHVAVKRCYNYSERIIKNTTVRVHLHNGKCFKANCDIDELPECRFPLTI